MFLIFNRHIIHRLRLINSGIDCSLLLVACAYGLSGHNKYMAKQLISSLGKHKNLITLGIALLVLYVLLPQIGSFKSSFGLLKHVDYSNVYLAAAFAFATYLAAAATYCLLAFHPLSYVRTIAIELAGMFLNRLVPAGLGSIGVNYRYLRKNGHLAVEAGSVVAVNNTLGFVGHMILLLTLLLTSQLPKFSVSKPNVSPAGTLIVASVLTLGLVFVVLHFQTALRKPIKNFLIQIALYRRRPLILLLALFSSITLTLCNVLALLLCAHAFGLDISFLTALIVFTAGIVLGTATPTPGGLGGIEAGLVAGLLAYHVGSAQAIAVVLTYRLLTYWLAILAGAATFVYVQRRGYI
jgi:uncharacterized membrane protein YbhN (UPF0104 family)